MIKVGSDFSGVGAFDQALKMLEIDYETVFSCDMDKYARQNYIHNYGEPKYYPENVYDREIPADSLDIYMTSPPCQAFSLAGKRLGKDDERGILFFNSHEFIMKNKPRFFIFENVKGLLSDDNGRTFQEWINYLGGKSVNAVPVLFPTEEAAPYHIYWKVLNAKDFNIPQNRERVFIIGIRDDEDNVFSWPKEEPLIKRLRDVLQSEVDEKYFLSEKMLEKLTFEFKSNGEVANINKGGERGSVYSEEANSMSCLSATDYKQPKQILVKSATKSGFEVATENDSIDLKSVNNANRGNIVFKDSARTLDHNCNQAVMVGTWRTHKDGNGFREIQDGNCPTIPARAREDGSGQPVISDGYRIRRLTPRECFRLMDFPESFMWPVSDSQAYKQAGNSICVGVLARIIKGLKKL